MKLMEDVIKQWPDDPIGEKNGNILVEKRDGSVSKGGCVMHGHRLIRRACVRRSIS